MPIKDVSKHLISVLILCLLASGQAQTPFFSKTKPEVTIVVKEHSLGPDMVEVTVLGSKYPEVALKEKIDALGGYLGTPARGLEIGSVGGMFLKAKFAIDGLINPPPKAGEQTAANQLPRVNIVPVAKAFAKSPEPLTSISIFFENVAPSDSVPARYFALGDVWMMEGVASVMPPGIEYRIKVNTTNLDEISLPGEKEAQDLKDSRNKSGKPDLILIGGLLVGAIAFGLLVYSALLSRQRGPK